MTWEDVLLDHNRRPRNRGPVDGATHRGQARNPFCGDEVSLELRIDADDTIVAAGFQAQACAVCTAAASILTTRLRGRARVEARSYAAEVSAALATPPDAPLPAALDGDLEALAGVRRLPVRIACAQLPFEAAARALAG